MAHAPQSNPVQPAGACGRLGAGVEQGLSEVVLVSYAWFAEACVQHIVFSDRGAGVFCPCSLSPSIDSFGACDARLSLCWLSWRVWPCSLLPSIDSFGVCDACLSLCWLLWRVWPCLLSPSINSF
eukprot:1137702-Pelagomonas_calceolata.AAC.3